MIPAGRSQSTVHFQGILLPVIKLGPANWDTMELLSPQTPTKLRAEFYSHYIYLFSSRMPAGSKRGKVCCVGKGEVYELHFLVLKQLQQACFSGNRIWDVAIFLTATRGRQYPMLGPSSRLPHGPRACVCLC